MVDMVNNPAHYSSESEKDIECLDAMHAMVGDEEFSGHLRCQALKYLWRYKKKGRAIEDLEKSIFFMNRLKDLTNTMIEKKEIKDTVETLNIMAAMHEGDD